MDNGAEFQTTLHWHVLDKGFARESIRPATPGFNGKVKRSFRMEGEEFYKFPEGVMIDDTYQLNETLQEWEKCFNDDRP